MRAFITATVLLSFIIMLTVCNSIYVTKRVDEMLYVCEILKSDSSAHSTDELTSRWENCRDIISLTTHRNVIERAENAILSLPHYLDTPADYQTQLSILISIFETIKNSQRIGIDNIL